MTRNIVAIVGRPNVGKSTFFNRCIGHRHAIVDDKPGVTRDRVYHEADWAGHEFLLVDTGGLIVDKDEELADLVYSQVKLAIDEADVIVFMVDGKSGLIGNDYEVANLLRKSKKPVIVAVNKIDEPKEESNIGEFYELGLGEPFGLSAMRGTGGVGDLLDTVVGKFSKSSKAIKPDKYGKADSLDDDRANSDDGNLESKEIAIAVVGRPNVGKSSMVNLLCGEERTIVSAVPGTTRDATDTKISFKGRKMTLIDTAGIRRKSRVDYGIEAFSVVRSLKAISRSDVAVFMLDATDEITDQDKKIAGKIKEAGKPAVIVLNKWDLVEDKTSRLMNEYLDKLKEELRPLHFAEFVFVSAKTGLRAPKILEAVERVFKETHRRVTTSMLNQIVNEAAALSPAPSGKRGKRLRIYYGTQVTTAPPTFVLFVNDPKLTTKSYEVYLERKLRESFGFEGTPIRLILRPKQK